MQEFMSDTDARYFSPEGDGEHAMASDSSEEDAVGFLRNLIKHSSADKRGEGRLKSRHFKKRDSSEDEFEKEMTTELDSTMRKLEDKNQLMSAGIVKSAGSDLAKSEPPRTDQCYDDIYFDSDSDGEISGKKFKQRMLSNDELLYDPDKDEADQRWVDKQRRKYQPRGGALLAKLPNSDAVLNCPACMATLCLDCQRHEVYKNQYRAMFVMHCTVDQSEKISFPQTNKKQAKKVKCKQGGQGNIEETEITETEPVYQAVKCSECSTVIAVIDSDEVFHFFNVLASYS